MRMRASRPRADLRAKFLANQAAARLRLPSALPLAFARCRQESRRCSTASPATRFPTGIGRMNDDDADDSSRQYSWGCHAADLPLADGGADRRRRSPLGLYASRLTPGVAPPSALLEIHKSLGMAYCCSCRCAS